MSNWQVVADLISLRAEFDALAPNRDKGADGTIGDQPHADRSSDHNPDDTPGSKTPHTDTDTVPEVHALDVDSTGPWPPGMSMAKAVSVIVALMIRLGSRAPLAYVIYDHVIYEYANGWRARGYDGTDPHTGHAHFSSRYGSGSSASNPENYAGPWGLIERFAVLNDDDKKWIKAELRAAVADVLSVKIDDQANPARNVGDVLRDVAKLRGVLVGDVKDTANARLSIRSPLSQLVNMPADLEDIHDHLMPDPPA